MLARFSARPSVASLLLTLRSRLVISTLLITLAGLLVVVLVFLQVLAQRSYDIKQHELATQAQHVARAIHRLYLGHAGNAALRTRVYDASRLLGERIIILGATGSIVVDSSGYTPFDTGSWYEIDLHALQRGASAGAALQSQKTVIFQSPIHGTRGHVDGGAVLLVAKVTDVRPSFFSLIEVAAALIATALVVWLLIGTYFTFSVFRPLLRITSATERMAKGDYEVRVQVHGPREIERLSASFNGMASRVQRTDRGQRDFVANVSHDLRTPLTVIAGFSQAMLDGTAGPEEVEALAEVINMEAGKMQQLVDDLLQLTKLESGLLTLDRHAVDTHEFVQTVMDRVRLAARPDVSVNMINAVPSNAPAIYADPARLERALQNLLDNAIAYSSPGGNVRVVARPAGRAKVEIRVTDTGPGISSQDLSRIFERFYRADRSRERSSGHSGLGLAIVREIVEAHGGTVAVESIVGEGTTFILTLPRAAGVSVSRIAGPPGAVASR